MCQTDLHVSQVMRILTHCHQSVFKKFSNTPEKNTHNKTLFLRLVLRSVLKLKILAYFITKIVLK